MMQVSPSERPTDIVSRAETLAALCGMLRAAPPHRVGLAQALGRVLAEPLVVGTAIPAAAVAMRAGFAVRATDLVGASPYSPVALSVAPQHVAVGDRLPPGMDAVLPPGACVQLGAFSEITQSVPPSQDVRRIGEDAAPGTILRRAGEMVRPVDLAAAGVAGLKQATIRLVRVFLQAEPLCPGAILLESSLRRAGADVTWTRDQEAAGDADAADFIVVVSDDLAGSLLPCDEVLAPAVAMRPGEGLVLARIGDRPLVVVPERLDAVLAGALLVLLPALAEGLGAPPMRQTCHGILTRKIASALGVTDLVLLQRCPEGLEPIAIGDASLAALTSAEAWLAIPPESEGLAEGSRVAAFPLAELFA